MGVDIVLRKRFEKQHALVARVFKEAGTSRNMAAVTSLRGTDREKVAEIDRLTRELTEWDSTLKAQARDTTLQRSSTLMEHDFVLPGERKAGSGEFESFGEFVSKVAFAPHELKSMGIDTGEGGGFLVPDDFRAQIFAVAGSPAVVRPRALVLPPGPSPDAKLSIPALRQGASGFFGGITFAAVNEGTAGAADDPKLDEIVLEPQRMSGYVVVGNSLLRNYSVASAFLENMFRNAIAAWEDYQFIQGAGGALPLGMINSPCKVSVPRTSAATIIFTDILDMMCKHTGNNPIWIASRSALPKLVAMSDTVGNSVWIVGDISKALPQTLAGYPLYFTDRQPALGTEGDLILVSPDTYIIKPGSGPFIQANEGLYFKEDQTIIRCTFWIDGQCGVKTPILAEDGATTVSPIVVLE